jgi:hypothetical protein
MQLLVRFDKTLARALGHNIVGDELDPRRL